MGTEMAKIRWAPALAKAFHCVEVGDQLVCITKPPLPLLSN